MTSGTVTIAEAAICKLNIGSGSAPLSNTYDSSLKATEINQ